MNRITEDTFEQTLKSFIRAAMIEASKDPLFLSDIEEVEKDFEYAYLLEADK
jgi:hypothetical protein